MFDRKENRYQLVLETEFERAIRDLKVNSYGSEDYVQTLAMLKDYTR